MKYAKNLKHKYVRNNLCASIFFSISVISLVAFSSGRSIKGVYKVPLSIENKYLEPYASYPIKLNYENYNKAPDSLTFPLPATLVGEEKIININKVPGSDNQWVGNNVESGTCAQENRELTCTLKFKDLNIDPAKLKLAIEQNYSPVEAANRQAVAELFGNEPLGIIIYKLRGRN